jgi:hypothetical protein
MRSICLAKCWQSHVPLPEILDKLLENQYLDFRKLSLATSIEWALASIWEARTGILNVETCRVTGIAD